MTIHDVPLTTPAVLPVVATDERLTSWLRPDTGIALDDLPYVDIAACPVHLVDRAQALKIIADAARLPHPTPLAVASINLDHVHHFGRGAHRLGADPAAATAVRWLSLVDGAPIARQATRFVGDAIPRLAGSDLIGPILDDAAAQHLSIAILGGDAALTDVLTERLAEGWPELRFAGHWSPTRDELAEQSPEIAAGIKAAGADIVVVCLGKPRQEDWIDAYGAATGAGVLLAFGAVVDFIAGRVSRAPRWVSSAGFEWMWRLMLEPRRLARRYLIEGPPAYVAVRRSRTPQRA
jgi:N-acetylglucosaminyldiphosphoundecaprenol N-acetyl-beta-D-mannosaminyltransferase